MHASKRPFLPGMKKHEELKEMVLASIEEHRQVKTLLREMGRLSSNKGDTEKVEAKLKVLNDNVEHHAEIAGKDKEWDARITDQVPAN